MKTKLSLIFLLIALNFSAAFAHALWIETPAVGKKGKAQEVKVFFGEYSENDPTAAAKWFSNLKAFKLILTAPNGATKILAGNADLTFFKASFTPDQEGNYKLSIVHEVADVFEHAKIQYYAFADVAVGNSKINTGIPSGANLTIRAEKLHFQTRMPTGLQVIYNKTPLTKQKISIVTPDLTEQVIETDAEGRFIFKPEQKGKYFVEVFTEDKTPGKLNGKDYEKVWHLATYTTEV